MSSILAVAQLTALLQKSVCQRV